MDTFIWCIVLAILLPTTIFGLPAYFAYRRAQAVKAIASQLDLDFHDNKEHVIPSMMWNSNLYSKERGRDIKNIVSGRRGNADVFIFDYQYCTGSSRHPAAHVETVVLLLVDGLHLPCFFLESKTFSHRVNRLFGYRTIEFAHHPDFSNRYVLRGSDQASIRQFFSYCVLDMYEAKQSRIYTEGMGNALIFYHHQDGGLSTRLDADHSVPPTDWHKLLEEALELASIFKQAQRTIEFQNL
ncbi:MAG: hypothetical protein AAGD25_26360 [Cyanobacteria bacterium P01_F01_bin.150]